MVHASLQNDRLLVDISSFPRGANSLAQRALAREWADSVFEIPSSVDFLLTAPCFSACESPQQRCRLAIATAAEQVATTLDSNASLILHFDEGPITLWDGEEWAAGCAPGELAEESGLRKRARSRAE